jgi:integrase
MQAVSKEKPRRGRDEGAVYQRQKDGRWVGAVSLGYDDRGQRRRKVVYGATEAEARKKLLLEQQRVASGLPVTNDQMTVAALFTDWLELVKANLRPKTFIYEQIARTHILPKLGRAKVSKVEARSIDLLLMEKQKAGLSPRTVLHIRAILRQAFQQAIVWDIVPRNVVTLTKPPTQTKYKFPVLAPEQVQTLFAAFEGHRYGAAYTVMGGLGLRLGEALGLRWRDVQFDSEGGGTVTVNVQLQHLNGKYSLVEPKSESGRRTIPLPRFVAAALKARQEKQEEERELEGEAWNNPDDLVFANYRSGPLDDARVRQRFKELLDKHGLPDIRLHDLRHICATLLISQKIEPRMVMEILGHSQISLTLNTYTHILKGATQAAADAMDGAIRPKAV